MQHIEIERKWLVEGFFDLPEISHSVQEQGYLAWGKNTVRIRKTVQEGAPPVYMLCIKGPGALARVEIELPLTAQQYTDLAGLLPLPPIKKQHKTYRLPGGETLECSLVDEGTPTAFYYAEIEFISEAAARAFQPPAYLKREVTGLAGYSMAAYYRQKIAGRGDARQG